MRRPCDPFYFDSSRSADSAEEDQLFPKQDPNEEYWLSVPPIFLFGKSGDCKKAKQAEDKKEPRKGNKRLPERCRMIMNRWFDEHPGNPYPDQFQREMLMKMMNGDIMPVQMKVYMCNRRVRYNLDGRINLIARRRFKK
jgi:hypothetical protein